MSRPFIIDAHAHDRLMGLFLASDTELPAMLALMDRLNIRFAVSTSQASLVFGAPGLPVARETFEKSGGRVYYLGGYDPNHPKSCLDALEKAQAWPGFAGIKIHPSIHRTMADDRAYRPAWEFAAAHDVAILSHTWSISDYNPVQRFSTPERFEGFIQDFPGVRFVLGHAGGRGTGRREAVRLANQYPNVFLDFAGDIFCYRLIEDLAASVPMEKILFGSDYPMMDPRANLTRVLLASIGDDAKRKILVENASHVYKIHTAAAMTP